MAPADRSVIPAAEPIATSGCSLVGPNERTLKCSVKCMYEYQYGVRILVLA